MMGGEEREGRKRAGGDERVRGRAGLGLALLLSSLSLDTGAEGVC